jgi:hypothetical protein
LFFKFSGFKKGGIYPFNRNVIQNSTYDPAALKRFEAHKKSIALVDEPKDPEICLNATQTTKNNYQKRTQTTRCWFVVQKTACRSQQHHKKTATSRTVACKKHTTK